MTEASLEKVGTLSLYSLAVTCLVLVFTFMLITCRGDRNSQTPGEKLDAYCVRECVLETGGSEVCDTICKCASNKLSAKLSRKEFAKLVSSITESGSGYEGESEYLHEFKNAFGLCKSKE